MTDKTCSNCIYHTYITSYTARCRIYDRLVASVEITNCDEFEEGKKGVSNEDSRVSIAGQGNYTQIWQRKLVQSN